MTGTRVMQKLGARLASPGPPWRQLHGFKDKLLTRYLLGRVNHVRSGDAKSIFLFNSIKHPLYRRAYALFAHELARRGHFCSFLFRDDLLNAYFGRLVIGERQISDSLSLLVNHIAIVEGTERPAHFSWNVDLRNGIAETRGVNFFLVLLSTLRSAFKCYNIDFERADILQACERMIKSCDLLFRYYLLLKQHARETGVPIRIVGWETNYIPHAVFRILCEKFCEDRDVEYVDCGICFSGYFGRPYRTSYIEAVNCTRYHLPGRGVVPRTVYDDFTSAGIAGEELSRSTKRFLGKEITAALDPLDENVVEEADSYLSQGRQVFVLFAHLFYDTPLDDSSPCFGDMSDWITATIDFFRRRKDLLILRPHPVEVWVGAPEKRPNETLASFLADKISPGDANIVLMPPRQGSTREISKHMSCGLVWRSSSALDLAYYRKPSIIAGNPMYKELLDLVYAKDRQDYFGLIGRASALSVTDAQIEGVTQYLHCLDSTKNTHVDCIDYDVDSKRFSWNGKRLWQHVRKCDPNVGIIVDKMLS